LRYHRIPARREEPLFRRIRTGHPARKWGAGVRATSGGRRCARVLLSAALRTGSDQPESGSNGSRRRLHIGDHDARQSGRAIRRSSRSVPDRSLESARTHVLETTKTNMETRTQLPEIRRRRGISAAHLARSAGVSRQTIYAMEAGEYVPNTSLALALARILEVHVEDLFQLEGEAQAPAKPVAAEVLHLGEPLRKGQPVQLCEVGKRLIAVPAEPQPAVLP